MDQVDGIDVFYRESPAPPDAPVMVHVHGFGLSGRYLLPTAERLGGEFHTLVPDLPGFGRSGKSAEPLDVPDLAHAAARFLDDRGIESATLVGNSMGCPVITEFALPATPTASTAPCSSRRPAACTTSRSTARCASSLATASREPPELMRSRSPTTCGSASRARCACSGPSPSIPSLERLLGHAGPDPRGLGNRDPLMPGPARVQEVASQTDNHVLLVIIEGAAHAINFSHPGELAHVIRLFMADQPIVDDPDAPGRAAPTRSTAACTCRHRRPTTPRDQETALSPSDADSLAARLLGGLRTKLGGRQIAHARRVADAVHDEGGDDATYAAALLHDVVEKGGITSAELLSETGDAEVVRLVGLLTREAGQTYQTYLVRCCADPRAVVIKRADLVDKFDPRTTQPSPRSRRRRSGARPSSAWPGWTRWLAAAPATG